MNRALVLVGVLLASVGCTKREEAQPVQMSAPPAGAAPQAPADRFPVGEAGDREALRALPIIDGVGFLTGLYGPSSNFPAMYADPERKLFVLLGRNGKLEVPIANAEDAISAYEQFLLRHGYPANGKDASDDHPKVLVRLSPEVPDELKKQFTPRQYEVILNTITSEGFELFSGHDKDYPPHPMMYAGAKEVFVVGPDTDKGFPITQASAAFAEYREMLKRTKLVP